FVVEAEDGIRDWSVTGVQTCALPIWYIAGAKLRDVANEAKAEPTWFPEELATRGAGRLPDRGEDREGQWLLWTDPHQARAERREIGRASCRGREGSWVGAGGVRDDGR